MSEIKGIILLTRFDYLERKLGPQAIRTLTGKLSQSSRHIVEEQIFPVNKYPFQLLVEIDTVIPHLISEPLEPIFREMGEIFSDTVTDRYFYNYLNSRKPEKLLNQLQYLYPYLWDFGEYGCRANSKKTEVQLLYERDIHKPYCWFMQEFIRRSIEISGGENISVKEKKCEAENDEFCLYDIKWEIAHERNSESPEKTSKAQGI